MHPQTLEGRILAVLLSIYGLAILGYITASIATCFLGEQAAADAELRSEIQSLRQEVRLLRATRLQSGNAPVGPGQPAPSAPGDPGLVQTRRS